MRGSAVWLASPPRHDVGNIGSFVGTSGDDPFALNEFVRHPKPVVASEEGRDDVALDLTKLQKRVWHKQVTLNTSIGFLFAFHHGFVEGHGGDRNRVVVLSDA